MKILKRMLLIHWHNYQKEVIEFDTINFLTGKTAAGKSTIIDALQLVLLGDTSGVFFNKAANHKSARTLQSYLFGEKGDDGDTGFQYLRNQRFTSYVALEFEDTQRKKYFTVGIVCDCYKDQSFDYKWFMINNQGFPENLFIDPITNIPYDLNGLKAFLSTWLGKKKNNEYEFFDTNKRYQEVSLGKFGQLKKKYHTLLKKAVPFSPIADIEKFITESICDVKNNIEIDQMQSDIRQYKNLEDEAKAIQEKVGFLQEIHRISKEYDLEKEKYNQQKYIVMRARLEEQKEDEQAYNKRIIEKQAIIEQQKEQMKGIKLEVEKLKEVLDKKETEYRTSSIALRERELKSQLGDLETKIKAIDESLNNAVKGLKTCGVNWQGQLKKMEHCSIKIPQDIVCLVEEMVLIEKSQLEDFPFENLADYMGKYKDQIQEYRVQLKNQLDNIKKDMDELVEMINDLKKGIKPYPSNVRLLKTLLEKRLSESNKKTVEVFVFADLLEIKNPIWRDAIEGYLDKQKFYLLVSEEYYIEALKIYESEKKRNQIYDIGLVDIGKLRKEYHRAIMPHCLAEEIETSHPDARLYVDYLLGNVIKCKNVEELNHYKIAITESCMLYKGYVSRNINPARYANPFIGHKSMQLLLEQKEMELQQQDRIWQSLSNEHRVIDAASRIAIIDKFEANQYYEATLKLPEREVLQQKYSEIKQEYDSLDLLFLERMKEAIKDLSTSIEEKKDLWHIYDKKNDKLENEIQSIQKEQLPQVIQRIVEIQGQVETEFDNEWIIQIGNPRYEQEHKANTSNMSLQKGFFAAMKKTEVGCETLKRSRREKRTCYNTLYKMPYDVELESNREFDNELENLESIRLPQYLDKIKESREKAYNQFRDDFLAKIKSNIESVSQQIDELNASLKQSEFGTDKYHFVKKPRAEYKNYYDMIMDPMLMEMGGWNITSQNFNAKYQKEINELFQLLILNETNVTAERRVEYEKSIRKFTDYKTYLVFDLIVTNDQGEEQRLSKTLLKKSGGETQIPFYIALLASFSQVYRIRNKNQNNTIRIIILDEAFSKMDGERIRESISLLRRFQLQAIFSAPPEKIADIAPLVDRNIAVYKDAKHSFTRNFNPKQIEEMLVEE